MPTTRGTPSGTHLEDGYQAKLTFQADPDVSLWEKTVQPPGLDGGDAIDQTTMWNTTVRTRAPRSLIDVTESSMNCAYDPKVYDQILALINVNTLITVLFSDGSRLDYWGFLKSFIPSEMQEGEQPMAAVSIVPTNRNASAVETTPNYYAVGSS